MLGQSKIVAFVPIRQAERAKAFYQDVLGLRFVNDDTFALIFDSNGVTMRLARVPEFQPHPFTVAGWDVKDIEETVKGLSSKGVQFLRFSFLRQDELGIWNAPGEARVAWFKDPDGNVLSVAQHA
jgi:catechol 2,3-dioxygenase-like lactoylglutathione lyase family enzyme